jgi:hypothetical protein
MVEQSCPSKKICKGFPLKISSSEEENSTNKEMGALGEERWKRVGVGDCGEVGDGGGVGDSVGVGDCDGIDRRRNRKFVEMEGDGSWH